MVDVEVRVMRVCNSCIIDDFGVEGFSQRIDRMILFLQRFASRSSYTGVLGIGGGVSLVRGGKHSWCGAMGRGSLGSADGLRGQDLGLCIIRYFFSRAAC